MEDFERWSSSPAKRALTVQGSPNLFLCLTESRAYKIIIDTAKALN